MTFNFDIKLFSTKVYAPLVRNVLKKSLSFRPSRNRSDRNVVEPVTTQPINWPLGYFVQQQGDQARIHESYNGTSTILMTRHFTVSAEKADMPIAETYRAKGVPLMPVDVSKLRIATTKR